MSWSYCAITGEALSEPVVSQKSGHVFEKRVIEKYLKSTGQCPLTGQALLQEDLIPLKLQIQTKPRSVQQNSVPQILKTFNNEWDTLNLECFNLRQQLDTVRQELSHALYQHDAACRVIARLIQERDQARKEVIALSQRIRDGDMDIEKDIEEEEPKLQKLPEEIINSINETSTKLNQLRKDRKKDTAYNAQFATPQAISGYKESSKIATSPANIECLDVNGKYIAAGQLDGIVSVYGYQNNAHNVVSSIDIQQTPVAIAFLNQSQIVVLSDHEGVLLKLDTTNSTLSKQYTFKSEHTLKGLAVHPNQTLFAVTNNNGQVVYHSVDATSSTGSEVLSVDVGAQITSIQIHPDGNLMGIGCADGSVKLWSIASNELLTSLEDGWNESVKKLSFSENGYTLACSTNSQVKIYDLRKAKCIKTIDSENSSQIRALEFDQSASILAIGLNNGSATLLETKKFNVQATLSFGNEILNALKFGEYSCSIITTASGDSNIIISA